MTAAWAVADVTNRKGASVDWQMFLFSTGGRITRAQFWLAALVYFLITVVASAAALFIIIAPPSELAALVLYVGSGLLFGCMFFSAMAVTIKRLHDRNKVGWWNVPMAVLPSLLFSASNGLVSDSTAEVLWLIATVLALWGVIELGCLRGTVGPNRFGEDPLAGVAAPTTTSASPAHDLPTML